MSASLIGVPSRVDQEALFEAFDRSGDKSSRGAVPCLIPVRRLVMPSAHSSAPPLLTLPPATTLKTFLGIARL